MLYRINNKASVTDITKDVNILIAIRWVQRAWKDVSPSAAKRRYGRCSFRKVDHDLMEAVKVESEFSVPMKELCPDTFPHDYIDFDAGLSTA